MPSPVLLWNNQVGESPPIRLTFFPPKDGLRLQIPIRNAACNIHPDHCVQSGINDRLEPDVALAQCTLAHLPIRNISGHSHIGNNLAVFIEEQRHTQVIPKTLPVLSVVQNLSCKWNPSSKRIPDRFNRFLIGQRPLKERTVLPQNFRLVVASHRAKCRIHRDD